MGNGDARIERYRIHAEELRNMAEECDERTKEQLLNMARDYDQMAKAMEGKGEPSGLE